MSAELLVGVDVGTTLTKASVVGSDGTELAWGRAPTTWQQVPSGAETTAAQLLSGVLAALAAALEAAPEGRVIGLGVTSMAEVAVLLGDDGLPVGRCIAWHDIRGEEEAEELGSVFGTEEFSARTGLQLSHVATLAKLAWMARHGGPRATRAMTVADWVVHALGGRQGTEASLASRTGALSLDGREWWSDGLAWAGAPARLFPPVEDAGALRGRVSLAELSRQPGPGGAGPGPAHALARLEGATIASAGHDHLCVAAGTGVKGEDQVLDSCGTAEAFVRRVKPMSSVAVAEVVTTGLAVGWHAVPGSYALLTGHLLGLLFDRVFSLLGVEGLEAQVALDRASNEATAGALRVEVDERSGTSSVLGIGQEASPAALWAAVRRHTAARAARTLATMESVAGPVGEVVLSGGRANFAGLRTDRAKLARRLRWPAVTEAGARGAALFGGCGAGLFSGPDDFPVPDEHL